MLAANDALKISSLGFFLSHCFNQYKFTAASPCDGSKSTTKETVVTNGHIQFGIIPTAFSIAEKTPHMAPSVSVQNQFLDR